MRFDACMYLEMSGKIAFLAETLAALFTLEWPQFTMGGQVVVKMIGPAKASPAQLAHKWSLTRMCPEVCCQCRLVHKSLATELTRVLLNANVDLFVLGFAGRCSVRFQTDLAGPGSGTQFVAPLYGVVRLWVDHFDILWTISSQGSMNTNSFTTQCLCHLQEKQKRQLLSV